MTAFAGKGKFNINGIVDLSTPGYTYSLKAGIDSLHTDEVVNSFFPKAKDTVFGLLSANLKLNGAGTKPEKVKNNLVADGDFNIKDGKITNAKITDNLSRFLNIDELKTLNLRQANGTIKIRNGVARLDSNFTSDDVAMNPSGDIGLDETLDLAFDLKLSPSYSKDNGHRYRKIYKGRRRLGNDTSEGLRYLFKSIIHSRCRKGRQTGDRKRDRKVF